MITCSKCEKQFTVQWQQISKDSTVPCPHCSYECLVRLLDFQNYPSESDIGFGGVKNIYNEIKKEDEKESKSLQHHLLVIIVILNLLAGTFILGIYNMNHLEENFPGVARFYNKINIFARKTISVAYFDSETSHNIMTVKLNLLNSCDQTELLSDVQILISDSFNNIVGATHIRPNKIMKGEESLTLMINIVGIKENAKKISIFINGKISFEDKLNTK